LKVKIITVIGARPQFIKAAVVSRNLIERDETHEILVHTGQHYDANMSDTFFEELDIPYPKYHLGIGGGTHGQNTGRMIERIENVLLQEKPNWLLLYGDTDSTLAGALAAVKLHIPVAHVEAGLRSFNRAMPEEINRVLTDHASEKLFTPTETAVRNLMSEGITGEKVLEVGDVMYDAALYYGDKAEETSRILNELGLSPKAYVLATLHREENVDDRSRLVSVLEGFAASEKPIVLPLHPRTRKRLKEFGLILPSLVRAIDPVGYLDMVMLEKNAAIIATDSGGVQKEAYFHKVPCITLRDETEWLELVEVGANKLVGVSSEQIASSLAEVGNSNVFAACPFGDGDAGTKIAMGILA
jgi:UDP-GlcNAc3NAcA epimerase